MENNNLYNNLDYLKLPHLRENINELAAEAARKEMTYLDFFESAIQTEVLEKQDRAVQRRIRRARLPQTKTLDSFDWNHPDSINREHIRHLFKLHWVPEHKNVAFIANAGLGKTHLALALAVQACRQRYNVHFCKVSDALEELRAARNTGRLATVLKTFTAPDILVLDELGFLPVEQIDAEMLFRLISARYERGSIVLTSNIAFRDWSSIFSSDTAVPSGLLDRFLHHCETVKITGKSYRMKDHIT